MAEVETPDDVRYSSEDEWARLEDDRVVVGITDYAQQQLGDIVYVELPEVGTSLSQGDAFGVIESVKAAVDLFAPISGEVIEVNTDLADRPEVINEDCYGDGWMIALSIGDHDEYEQLLDAAAYQKHCDDRSE